MLMRFFKLFALIFILFILPVCGGTLIPDRETMLDKNWGKAFETVKYNQTLNPRAGKDETPVYDLDGQAVQRTMDKYHETFSAQPGDRSYNLYLGDIAGIGNQ